MQNFLFADAIGVALKNAESDFDIHRAASPEDTIDLCRLSSPMRF